MELHQIPCTSFQERGVQLQHELHNGQVALLNALLEQLNPGRLQLRPITQFLPSDRPAIHQRNLPETCLCAVMASTPHCYFASAGTPIRKTCGPDWLQ